MKKIIYIVSFLILALAGLIIYEAVNINSVEDFNIKVMPAQKCDLHSQNCKVSVPELGEAILSFAPRPIQMNKSLNMFVTTSFEDQVEVWIDFLGLEMEMGFNRTKLKYIDNKYSANGFLPTCSEKKMTWKTTLLIKKGDVTYGYEYRFVTELDEE